MEEEANVDTDEAFWMSLEESMITRFWVQKARNVLTILRRNSAVRPTGAAHLSGELAAALGLRKPAWVQVFEISDFWCEAEAARLGSTGAGASGPSSCSLGSRLKDELCFWALKASKSQEQLNVLAGEVQQEHF